MNNISPGREMTIQSLMYKQDKRCQTNPEDFTSNLGRIYSKINLMQGKV